MNILFISYGIYEYDGRTRELMEISEQLGKTQYITRGISQNTKWVKNHCIISNRGIFAYLKFIFHCIIKAIGINKIDILFVDNRKAIIPALIIKLIKKPKYIIQDVRELYIIDEVKHITGKIGCIIEKILIKRSDIIICANKYRAKIMKNYYKLDLEPLVYENVRALKYSGRSTQNELKEKYKHYFTNNTIKIVSTSGCDMSRNTDKLVYAMDELGKKFELFLVGCENESDISKIQKIIQEKNLDNVHLINKLEIDELKYFLNNCNIGIVNYHKQDMNNIYCASGKIYEYIFEGLPVVTTENIPLVDICNAYEIGVADDDYVEGIKKVAKKYNFYSKNVEKYVNKISVENNNLELIEDIKLLIKTSHKDVV